MRYREFKIAEQKLNENASGFTQITVGGRTYDVGNDLIRNGNSYAIFSGDSARQFAEANGYIVPPIEVIQAVYAQGRQLVMPARNNNPTDTNAEEHTQEIFEANGLNGFPSGLVYGHKKEIVAPSASRPGRTRIFGGIWPNGSMIQSDSSVHGGGYVDYSQGMRACKLSDGSTASSGSGSLDTTVSTRGAPEGGEEEVTVDGVITAGPPYPQEDMAEVRNLQQKLEAAGYSVGSTGIDGKYGPRTTRAVAAFKSDYSDQISNNSATTVNPEDMETIEAVVSGSIPRVETPRLTGNTVEIDPETGNRVRSRERTGSAEPATPVDDYIPSNSLFDGPETNAATIRFNNPGGMYPARWQSRFGGTDTGARIGGGHRIAMFPDRVSGAAALFALLNGRLYRDKTVAEAMRTWTGNNNARSYINWLQSNGIDTEETVRNFLANRDAAIGLGVLMARWETGHAYPLSRSDWEEAYERSGVES